MNNPCRQFQQDLNALVDGELPAERQAEVIAHVDTCADCSRRVAQLQRLATGLGTLPKQPAPPGFLVAVRQKIAAPPRRWTHAVFRPLWLKVPLEALAVIALVALGAWWFRPPPPPAASGTPATPSAPAVAMKVQMLNERETADKEPLPTPVKTTGHPETWRAEAESDRQLAAAAVPAEKAAGLVGIPALAPVVVQGDSLVAVRMRVENIARDLEGRVEAAPGTNALMVYLRASQVETFRARLSPQQLRRAGNSVALGAARKSATEPATVAAPAAPAPAAEPTDAAAAPTATAAPAPATAPTPATEPTGAPEPLVAVPVVVEVAPAE